MLQGKVAVVIGAARGMGRASAHELLEEGAKLVAIEQSWKPTGVSNDRDDLWLKELESRPDDALVLTYDVGDEEQTHATRDAAGTLHIAESTVRKQIERARMDLRLALKDED